MIYIKKHDDDQFFMYPFKIEFSNEVFLHMCDHDGPTEEYTTEIDVEDLLSFLDGMDLNYNFEPDPGPGYAPHNDTVRMSCRVENQLWQGPDKLTTLYLKHFQHVQWVYEEYKNCMCGMTVNAWMPELVNDKEIRTYFIERKLMGDDLVFDETLHKGDRK